jgi:hypothetical protein
MVRRDTSPRDSTSWSDCAIRPGPSSGRSGVWSRPRWPAGFSSTRRPRTASSCWLLAANVVSSSRCQSNGLTSLGSFTGGPTRGSCRDDRIAEGKIRRGHECALLLLERHRPSSVGVRNLNVSQQSAEREVRRFGRHERPDESGSGSRIKDLNNWPIKTVHWARVCVAMNTQ